MLTKRKDSYSKRQRRKSLSGRVLRSTTLNILILVALCCAIMVVSMQSLANSILLDNLQPTARQSAKTVEANIHMLAERMMMIAGDSRMNEVSVSGGETAGGEVDAAAIKKSREAVLSEAAEIYELHTIALYDMDGRLVHRKVWTAVFLRFYRKRITLPFIQKLSFRMS